MDINEEINYVWQFGWDKKGYGESRPIVNRLLRAIIEKNVDEMESLFAEGASMEKIHRVSFERTLYFVLDDINVIQSLIEHGFQGFYGCFMSFECIDNESYCKRLTYRAAEIKSYDVMELLIQNGFSYNGNFDEYWFKNEEILPIKILLENGRPRNYFDAERKKYPRSKVTQFLNDNPFISRKTILLDPDKYRKIPKPTLKKVGFLFRKSIEEENHFLMRDYEDRIAAQERLKKKLGEEKWNEFVENEKFWDKEGGRILWEVAQEAKREGKKR